MRGGGGGDPTAHGQPAVGAVGHAGHCWIPGRSSAPRVWRLALVRIRRRPTRDPGGGMTVGAAHRRNHQSRPRVPGRDVVDGQLQIARAPGMAAISRGRRPCSARPAR